jgi:sulfatase modifying factor 1
MKLKAFTLTLAALCIGIAANAQSLKKLPKLAQKELKNLKYIPAGSYDELVPNKEKKKWDTVVHSTGAFYLSKLEVTNDDWRDFHKAMVAKFGKEDAKRFLPDTSVWTKSFPYSYNQPMMDYYYYHPAYAKYPAVGITWNQAKAYCDWRTEDINNKLKADGFADATVILRLPTKNEWTYVADPLRERQMKSLLSGMSKGKYDNYLWNLMPYSMGLINKNGYQANFGQILDTMGVLFKSYVDDGVFHTGPVTCYWPNDKGLYNIRGNVEEWVADNTDNKTITPGYESYLVTNINDTNTDMRICKGGSWVDGPYYLSMRAEKNYPANVATPFTGFRVAMDIVEVQPVVGK